MNHKTRFMLVILGVFAVSNAAVVFTGHRHAVRQEPWEQTELVKKWRERVSDMIAERHQIEAITVMRNYLRHSPGDGSIRRMLGKVLFEIGRYEEARETYYAALLNDRDDFVSRNNMGVVLMKLGYLRDAIRELKDAFDASEQGVFVAANLVYCYERSGDRKNAARFRASMQEGMRHGGDDLIPEDALVLDAEAIRAMQARVASERGAAHERP